MYFVLSYLNTKPFPLKKKNVYKYLFTYIYIKPEKLAGLPRDRTSGRMLVLQEFIQFLFEHGYRGTHSGI